MARLAAKVEAKGADRNTSSSCAAAATATATVPAMTNISEGQVAAAEHELVKHQALQEQTEVQEEQQALVEDLATKQQAEAPTVAAEATRFEQQRQQ